jgi:acyl-homoserine lactone acylase PvdQ
MMIRSSLVLIFLMATVASFAQIDPSKIDIVRDHYGVPHIFGKTDPEVAYGLAWAQAEDDFETIQLSMLAGKAMLASYKGKEGASVGSLSTLPSDGATNIRAQVGEMDQYINMSEGDAGTYADNNTGIFTIDHKV